MASSSPEAALDPKFFRRILTRNTVLPLLLAAAVSAAFALTMFDLFRVGEWVDRSDRSITEIQSAFRRIVDSETGVRGFVITGQEPFLEPYVRAQEELPKRFGDLETLINDQPAQLERLRRIQGNFASWLSYARELIELRRSGGEASNLVVSGRGKAQMDEIRRQFAGFLDGAKALRDERTAAAARSTTTVLFTVIIGTVLGGALLAFFSRRQLLVLANNYGTALRVQAEQNASMKKREWIKSGQAQLGDRMRLDLELRVLAREALAFLARYVDAPVGALYARDALTSIGSTQARDPRFHRLAGHALAQVDETQSSFAEGERVVGRAAAENRPVHFKDLPPSYLRVSTGLGEAPPSEVLVLPLSTNDGAVVGVLELASLQGFTDLHKEFLESVTERVAIGLRAAQERSRIEALLEETQQQAEELQSQQEELRVNNEELEEQTQALTESKTRLTEQKEQLEGVNAELAAQRSTLEDQAENLARRNDELVGMQKSIEGKARELELANRYKSEFLANMSHELRTPLNSSLLLVRLLLNNEKGNLDADQLRYLETVHSSSNDLLTLINDILDLSKVESGRLELDVSDVAPTKVVEALRRTVEPLFKEKGLKFEVSISPGTAPRIVSDRLRLEQILRNFLSNALKFTERGSVRLSVGPAPGNPGLVSFEVADSGVGIPADKLELIYEPFRQADGRINRKYGGTGLGLSISKDLAGLLGGSIQTESEVGKGSTFRLILPLRMDAPERKLAPSAPAPVTSTPRPPAAKPSLKFNDDRGRLSGDSRVLLIVEDDVGFVESLYSLAHSMGFQVLVAGTADEGVALAREFTPVAILLDLNLPDHNGLTVLDRLKQNPKTRHIPTHIISAADRARAGLEMGAVGFLRKPVAMEQLRHLLQEMQRRSSEPTKRVLIVEDNPAQREGIVKLVGSDGIETVAVSSGQEALAKLEQMHFDCMITDLSLPDMEGDALLASMAQQDLKSRPPVIVYTGRALDRATEEKLLHYSRTIVIKGAHSPERLLSEVTLFLHRAESNLPAEHQKMLSEFRSRERVFAGRKILLVDDDVRNLFALSSALEQRGAKITVARTGKEGIDQLQSHPDFDLVLMDVMMPEMDGYEATRHIRKEASFARLPVIMLTAKAMKDDQERAISAGANDYLAKPVELEKLLSLVRVWMPRGHRIES